MKEKVYLAAIRREMQAQFHFENRNAAFANFWYGWTHKCMRLYKASHQNFANKWKRGFLKEREARDFWEYITQ